MAITAIIAGTALVAGIGISAYGMSKQQQGYKQQQQGYQMEQQAAEQAAVLNKNIVNDEQQQEDVRRQAMELDAKRNTIQQVRSVQQARAINVASAVSQGAGPSGGSSQNSALQGGIGQAMSQGNYNIMGIKQNLAAGEHMFDINADISKQKLSLADTQTLMAQGQGQVALGGGQVSQGSGFMSLGGSIVGAAGTFSNIAGSFGAKGSNVISSSNNNPAIPGSLY